MKLREIELYDAKVTAPIKSGTYFVISDTGAQNLFYSRRHGGWNMTDDQETREYELFVDYWANLELQTDNAFEE